METNKVASLTEMSVNNDNEMVQRYYTNEYKTEDLNLNKKLNKTHDANQDEKCLIF
jgi:hypothetical protein